MMQKRMQMEMARNCRAEAEFVVDTHNEETLAREYASHLIITTSLGRKLMLMRLRYPFSFKMRPALFALLLECILSTP